MSENRPGFYLWFAIGAFVLVVSVALRLPGLRTDLWLDEVWSIRDALGATGWLDVLLNPIDNNHQLNSLYVYWVGRPANLSAYRMLAFWSGLASVGAAWALAARDSRLAGVVTALLFATSYLMVFYSSEARGYAPAVWFTLSAWYFLRSYLETPHIGFVVGFGICCVLGIMAHQTFVFFLAGAFFFCDVYAQRHLSLKEATRHTLRIFAAPVAFVAIFYILVIHRQAIGGGPPFTFGTVVAQLLSAMSGGPPDGNGMWVTAGVVGAVALLALASAYRAGDDDWILFGAAGIIVPGLLLVARQPSTLSPRYLIVPGTVLLIAIGRWLARLVARGGVTRLAAIALVIAHMGGGLVRTLSDGVSSRGLYANALTGIASESTGVTMVASANEFGGSNFRASLLVRFYADALGLNHRIRYVEASAYPASGTDWIIGEAVGQPEPFRDPFGNEFVHAGGFPAGALSGTAWYLYRRSSHEASR